MNVRELIERLRELPESATVRLGPRFASVPEVGGVDWDAQDPNRVGLVGMPGQSSLAREMR